MSENTNIYFAADDADKCVATLQDKCDSWFSTLVENRYLDKMKRSWNAYYGLYFDNDDNIGFGGEQGELVEFAINHYRNIAEVQLRLITSNRPAFQARSTNTDSQSEIQTNLANGLLDYYMREKRLERYLKKAVEYAVVMGSGYVKMEWNSTAGQIYDYISPEPKYNEDGVILQNDKGELVDENGRILNGFPVYEGDVKFSNLSPFDVVFDSTKDSPEDHDWVVTRTFKNKFDLAVKYPEFSEQIKGLATKSDNFKNRTFLSPLDETVDVPVYELFHRRTESVPDGRYVLYLDSEIILMDTAMPYRNLPVYRISPSDILGTPYGYTTMFALLPIQDAYNSLISTALTNQNAYGVQNVINPMGNGVSPTSLEGGMNFIQYNGAVGKPEALNLTQTPPEIFNFMKMLESAMETVSGMNSVARGNPESSLKSGTALALVQSQALQFISGLQQSYNQLIEDVGTGLIKLLQDFATVPRIAEISGIANRTKISSFKNDDIQSISRVVVDEGNPLSKTTAGRTQMADNLIQMGLINTPQDYFSVINTGRLDVMTQDYDNQNILIRAENEKLMDGSTPVVVIDTDDHMLHIRHHRAILNDPDKRIYDGEFVRRTLEHINEHVTALREVNPDLLQILQQQPLGPVGGSPVSQDNAAPTQPSSAGNNAEFTAQPQQQSANSGGLPNQPQVPPIAPNGNPT